MKDIISTLADDFKFTEEILELREDFSEPSDKPFNYNITFNARKQCKISNNNPAINNTSVCRNCYYKKFAEKITSIRKTKRKDFILHQTEIRQDRITFLRELREFLTDNEDYFDDVDYLLVLDFNEHIEELLINLFSEPSEQDRPLTSANMNDQVPISKELDVFISHSSIDKIVASKLCDLLIISLGIDPNKIRCTSVEGHKLKGGVNTDEQIRKEIHDTKVFIGLISRTSLRSHYVLFELGARWGLHEPLIPIVTSQSVIEIIEKPLNNLNLFNLEQKSDIYQMLEEVSEVLNVRLASASKTQNYIDDIVNIVKEKEVLYIKTNNESEARKTHGLDRITLKILTEIDKDNNGSLLIADTLDGYDLVTNGKSFSDNNDPRERAKLEASLFQLLDYGFISDRSTNGTVFGMTKDGYDFIEKMK